MDLFKLNKSEILFITFSASDFLVLFIISSNRCEDKYNTLAHKTALSWMEREMVGSWFSRMWDINTVDKATFQSQCSGWPTFTPELMAILPSSSLDARFPLSGIVSLSVSPPLLFSECKDRMLYPWETVKRKLDASWALLLNLKERCVV